MTDPGKNSLGGLATSRRCTPCLAPVIVLVLGTPFGTGGWPRHPASTSPSLRFNPSHRSGIARLGWGPAEVLLAPINL